MTGTDARTLEREAWDRLVAALDATKRERDTAEARVARLRGALQAIVDTEENAQFETRSGHIIWIVATALAALAATEPSERASDGEAGA